MVLGTSPRKVPLAGGDDWESGPSTSKPVSITKRVFFCGIVVENNDGDMLSEEVQELISSFGDPVQFGHEAQENLSSAANPSSTTSHVQDNKARRRAMTDSSAVQDVINEFVATERSYVKRLRILKHDYADPLRTYARSKETAIIPAYEANTLFGNIDALLPVNEAFLTDLERMLAPDGLHTVGYIGDVALKHFKQLRGFDLYKQFYVKREEAQAIFEREMAKKSRFSTFVDRIKYSSADMKNRVGLRELVMDPVQRIPRYTLMFRTMIKHMSVHDPQRAKLIEADEIASKIALAETDDATKRASVMHCLGQTIEGFPPNLISHSRRLIDCIDVDDLLDGFQSSTSSNNFEPLHCTLFLFDDKLMIVKRPADKPGHVLSGLDRLEKITKSGGLPSGMRRGGLSCKGVIELPDVVAADVDGGDFHLYFETPLQDQSERWAGRPFRSFSVVHPPSPPNFSPLKAVADKKRFLENLWKAQVDLRSRTGDSITLQAEELTVEARGNRQTVARAYFHVYQRTSFIRDAKKTKVVVQIDPLGDADPVPFGVHGPPYVVIRVQPTEHNVVRFKITSSDPTDENEEEHVKVDYVRERVIHTIHHYGLFKFRTGKHSAPSTPTASRTRAAIFGLDAISRNLFSALPGASKDVFGSSVNGSRRSKSTTRSSLYTQSSEGSLMRFSHRSNSSSMTSFEDESPSVIKSPGLGFKYLRSRSKSPSASIGESNDRSHSRANSVSREASPSPFYDDDEEEGTLQHHGKQMDSSEWDLAQRLELARRNSQNQRTGVQIKSWEMSVEDTIYEEVPPQPVRPASRASTAVYSQRTATPQPRPRTPSRERTPLSRALSVDLETPNYGLDSPIRTPSRGSERPRGPRSPSPFHTNRASQPSPLPMEEDSIDMETAIEATLLNIQRPQTPAADDAPPNEPRFGTAIETPDRKSCKSPQKAPSLVEPLSIKKKTHASDSHAPRLPKAFSKTSPLTKGRVVSPRRVSSLVRHTKTKLPPCSVDENRLIQLSDIVREDLEASRRAVKRIKLDVEQLKSSKLRDVDDESTPSPTPWGLPRTPQRATALTANKAAQERMEEMRHLIGKRNEPSTPKSRPFSMVTASPQTPNLSSASSSSKLEEITRLIDEAASGADSSLSRACINQEALGVDLVALAADLKERTALFEKARIELQSHKRQCELVKSLLNNAVAENALVYDTVNEELEDLFKSAQLPETEAWSAMANDVRRTKAARNELAVEVSQLKRRLAEVESEKEEWGSILRQHGLLP